MSLITLPRNNELLKTLIQEFPGHESIMKWFLALNEVPRPSHHTQAGSEWCMKVGQMLGGKTKMDKIGNVHIAFPATPGFENSPACVLQGHIDMVGTKKEDIAFNFEKDQLDMYYENGLLHARGTTLGADDGTGIAVALAIAEMKNIKRGPLELLFTVDEEVGLLGASSLVEGELLTDKAKYIINIDSEDWGEICLSCAGGIQRLLHIPVKRAPIEAGYTWTQLKLKDFRGGHTGVEIHQNRANAIKWAVTMLVENKLSTEGTPFRIAKFDGGNAHNAVPSACEVIFGVPSEKSAEFIAASTQMFEAMIPRWNHIETSKPKCEFITVDAPKVAPLTPAASKTMLRCIECVHHGIFRWSDELEGLVECSQSCSVVHLMEKDMEIEVFARSSTNSRFAPMNSYLESVAQIYGGVMTRKGFDMSGWPAEPNSILAVKAGEVFRREFKTEPKITSIHAGLECGVIMGKYPKNQMQSISVGPTVKNPHTVEEFVEVKTFCQVFDFVSKLVEELK
eukprot:TRINITY_DN1023_c0_g1_i1.p1 TRINITY_DN1023_c0_g1~~TRINITY_DN1023_c0_g1_i1.p1  ORF type:complete len:569 (-),score=122.27 TRINITY_DN1023_c0_g1_i1:1468-2994(-)